MNKPNKSLSAAIADYQEFNHLLGICPITGIATELKSQSWKAATS